MAALVLFFAFATFLALHYLRIDIAEPVDIFLLLPSRGDDRVGGGSASASVGVAPCPRGGCGRRSG